MAKNGNVNVRELEEFRRKINSKLGANQVNAFIESCAKELAARLLAKVIKRTPTGVYPAWTGEKGGTLKRGWTGEKSQGASSYVGNLKVNHYGGVYVIEIINPVEYASYVEFGHRTRGGAGWVEGKFMLTLSEQEIQAASSKILEAKLKKYLEECFK